eukprot:m.950696 g.950696  ORF g.950696 m.950696 type:complete len:58 (+) comp331349_c0_seq1:3-176(+)
MSIFLSCSCFFESAFPMSALVCCRFLAAFSFLCCGHVFSYCFAVIAPVYEIALLCVL